MALRASPLTDPTRGLNEPMKSIRIQLSRADHELAERIRQLGFDSHAEVLRLAALACMSSSADSSPLQPFATADQPGPSASPVRGKTR